MQFGARIEINNINPYVLVDATRATALQPDWKRPMPVLVQINGAPEPPWRINMMPIGDGSFYLYLSGVVREASGTGVGDEVEVTLSFDPDYRGGPTHDMPAEFARQLAESEAAQAAWDKLIPSRKKEVLRYLAGLKSEETRLRNIKKAMRVLSGARERFMARDWNT